VVTLEWIRDRIAQTLDPVTLVQLDTLVSELGTNVMDEDLTAAAHTAHDLRDLVSGFLWARSPLGEHAPETRFARQKAEGPGSLHLLGPVR
jgi:hypothetical protein